MKSPRPIDVHKLADEAKFNSFHRSVLLWCSVILVLDGYDLAVAGTALPSIMKAMNVDAATAGFMASSALFGMMFGAVGLGALADRIGRRWAIAICMFMFSVFTAAAGFTSDPITFSVMRFLAGLGIGGAIPTAAAQMTEYSPKKVRGLMVTLMCCGYALGSMLAALLGKQFIETYGWQSVFIAAGAPVVLVPFILKYMPESLPFLIKQHDDARLREVVRRIRPDIRFEPHEEFLVPAGDKAESSSVARLFLDGRGFSSVMLWIAFMTCLFMLYALSSWLVKLMGMAGYSLGSALNFLLAYNTGAVVGAVGGGWLADKLNIKWVTAAFFAVAAVSLTFLGYGAQPLFLIVAIVGASTLGTQILLYAYAGQFYPTSIRSTGLGFASGVGRIGAIAAPIAIGLLVSMELPLVHNFLAIALAAAIGGVAVALINHKSSDTLRPTTNQGKFHVSQT
ncbi:AAHS family benzoate transporter-like MFS transporter [Variovorax paradoxus]|uniref:AAHS family benzoate transporter-like MFS transporter n=1 Tax=Variovorax paradoxus TaxID=34073 RepID=A0AAE3Y5P7_VARPD|nr:MFS transporter [Variovorax paradoxus]MDP9968150.1 AAHS family benzoate transporter-like MFS transporter [Variovorax paradoxus]MDR6429773.1 AAHS family benzoate transporter-like MFS transporter [Variovorax paradoxus]MDR6456154.1 AAHS family benzoate transporter-like MFS transporter [Variovorax paradoxus]